MPVKIAFLNISLILYNILLWKSEGVSKPLLYQEGILTASLTSEKHYYWCYKALSSKVVTTHSAQSKPEKSHVGAGPELGTPSTSSSVV